MLLLGVACELELLQHMIVHVRWSARDYFNKKPWPTTSFLGIAGGPYER